MTQPIVYDQANLVQRVLRRFAASGPGSWLFARILHHIDRPVYRLTRGRYTLASLVSGLPVVMLTTTGAKSGHPRTVPVLGIPANDGVAIIASNYGQHRHPAWYYNLRAHPDADVAVDGIQRRVRAVEAGDERRAEIWQEGLRIYPGFAQYERRASHRRISVFVLEPV
ncbi:MAG TPA: nitroreductase family deazaflavin-dependent oxidoreductase [Solirubrobacteraceae bacterium]